MELRTIILLFRKDYKVFFGIIASFLFLGTLFFIFQGKGYDVSLTFSITRDSAAESTDYSYDDFYRLQADERFADTVVRWLQSPRIVEDIYTVAGIDTTSWSLRTLKNAFGSQRLSSQIIAINYAAQSHDQAEEIGKAAANKINQLAADLNAQQNETGWFIILSEEPIVKAHQYSLIQILTIIGIIGLFTAFWTVIIRYYLRTEK